MKLVAVVLLVLVGDAVLVGCTLLVVDAVAVENRKQKQRGWLL